jgi:hypothetical protein
VQRLFLLKIEVLTEGFYMNLDEITLEMDELNSKYQYAINASGESKRDFMIRLLFLLNDKVIKKLEIPSETKTPHYIALIELMLALHDVDEMGVTSKLFKSELKRQGKKANSSLQMRRGYVKSSIDYLIRTQSLSEAKAVKMLAEKIGIKISSVESDLDKIKREDSSGISFRNIPIADDVYLSVAIEMLRNLFPVPKSV